MSRRARAGFTILELLFALLAGGVLMLVLARLSDTVSRMGDASRAGADARLLEGTTERVLRQALGEAGSGMPSSANLGGVGVRMATRPDGTPADTLVVLRGDGPALAVAVRGCRAGASPCVVLVGDQRARIASGDLLVVGTRGLGLAAYQVVAAPAVFQAPCAADCPERLLCPVTLGEVQYFPRVVGSVRQPGGEASPAPCPGPFFPDGARCEEVIERVAAGPRQEPACRAEAPGSAFTEVRVADRTAETGYPAPVAPLTRSGVGGAPGVHAVRVRAARFWVRATPGGNSVLVRENGMLPGGGWRAAVGVAGPVRGMRVETLHGDGLWRSGAGVTEAELNPDPGNPNYMWRAAPDAAGAKPGSSFLRGYNTISAVRVHYQYLVASPGHGLPTPRDGWLVAATPALLAGGTLDVR